MPDVPQGPPKGSTKDPDVTQLDAALRESYRSPHPLELPARARLLARLAQPGPRGLGWWLASQAFVLRPAVAAGVLVLTLGAGAWLGARWMAGARSTRTARAAGVPVTFVLRAPGATSVAVAGDFNSWDAAATPMVHAGSGDLWIVNVTLPRGVHLYSFVLDGAEWRPDPSAPLAAGDAFGGHNSVIVVNGAKAM